MTNEKTAKIKTSCQPCIFAQFDNDKQIGCDLDRLEKFKQSDQAILSDDKSFFIINSICNTCRGKTWADNHLGKNLVAEVEKEIEIKFDFVILACNGEDHAKVIDRCIKRASECVDQQKIKPKNVVFVIKNKEVNYESLFNTLKKIFDLYNINFQLVRVTEEEADIYRCLDMGVFKCKSRYFGCFTINDRIPNNLLITLDDRINKDLKKLIMTLPFKDMSGLILHKSLYSLLGKNYEKLIHEKVKELADEQEAHDQILNWEDLWTRQPLLS